MEPEDATILMNAAAQGDNNAADRLLPLVYDQLRRAAQQRMSSEDGDHTLSATALVHEAYSQNKRISSARPAEVDRTH